MLALPLVSAITGLWWGLVLMFLMWGLAAYGGLLIAESCRACPEAENLHGVVGRLLGKTGQFIAMLAMLFLYYSLCAAYISGGASVLKGVLSHTDYELSFSVSAMLITLVIAVLVVLGTAVVDLVNRFLFVLMLGVLCFILTSLIPQASVSNLALNTGSPAVLLAALPVLYTSFGYHCAVPTVVQYVNGKPRQFRQALIFGSVLPFGVYVVWKMVVIGVLSSAIVAAVASEPYAVNSLMSSIGDASLTPNFSYVISFFTALALGTSFLGVALGLFDYLAEVSHSSHGVYGRIKTITITLLLPMLAAIFMPGSFITALGYAAIALVILAVFIPVAMVWRVRQLHMEEPYQVAGGVAALILAMLVGTLVILSQIGIVAGLLPAIG